MSSSLESTPPGPSSPQSHYSQPSRGAESLGRRSSTGKRPQGVRSIDVMPYTTYCEDELPHEPDAISIDFLMLMTLHKDTSTPAHQLHRHAAMSLLLKTSEGRERTLRFVQHMLRLYVFLKSKPDRARDSSTSLSAARRAGSPRTTRLLLLVFFLSAFRKFRSLCELIAPFTPSATKSRLRAVAGSSDFTPYTSAWSGLLIPPRATGPYASNNISASRWLWTEKHAWAGVDPREDGAKAAMPPVSDDNSILLRQRLQGIEVTLSLLDTISDGVALFAKLGVTISLPFQLLHNRLLKRIAQTRAVFNQSKRTRGVFEKLSTRAELLADLFWLSGTLVSLAHSEWERREVWKYGRRVRRLMREEEVERDRAERELELQMSEYRTDENSVDDAAYAEGMDEEQRLLENERRIQRIRDQRRTLRDLRGRLTWLWWDRLRLGADAVFALYDLFEWRPGSEAVRAVAGAISAGVGFSQIWSESTRHSTLASRSRRPSMSM